jgi:hypothetical protein
MQPIVIQPEGASPPFEADPIAWFAWAAARIEHGESERVVRERPTVFEAAPGHRWRVVRTAGGIEIRPDLGTTFLRETPNPLIAAVQVSDAVVVELCSKEGRWTGRFELGELDLAEIGRAMIEERHLPHDNLRFLFGRDRFAPDDDKRDAE